MTAGDDSASIEVPTAMAAPPSTPPPPSASASVERVRLSVQTQEMERGGDGTAAAMATSPVTARSFLRRRGSIAIAAEETRRWKLSHPIGPVMPYAGRLIWEFTKEGPQWLWRTLCMFGYVLVLLPAFLQIMFYYLTSSDIVRNVRFGGRPRNFLDIYLPTSPRHRGTSGRPVVVFVTGGIWIIGYKAWGAFFGRVLSAHGIVAVTPDYRNYPQGTVDDMLADTAAALDWVTRHIDAFGGDPQNVSLMGQSAGAHLSALLALLKGLDEIGKERQPADGKTRPDDSLFGVYDSLPHAQPTSWKLPNIRRLLLLSGPFDLVKIAPHFQRRGLYRPIMAGIMGGEQRFPQLSPTLLVTEHKDLFEQIADRQLFPEVYLFHGSADTAVPHESATEFCDALLAAGITASHKVYPGKSHTDPLIEDIVYVGNVNEEDVITDVAAIVTTDRWPLPAKAGSRRSFKLATEEEAASIHAPMTSARMSMVPWITVALARLVCPF